MNKNYEIAILFFLQLSAILAACRMVGWMARRIGQPQVVGEMIAGVVLGPSVFGLLGTQPFSLPIPDLQQALFGPAANKTVLYCCAQVGLTLYMFLIGVDFSIDLLRQRGKAAVSVSIAGMIVPFGLGVALAALFYQKFELFNPEARLGETMLFLGAAMCITAFPMLARILFERGISGTSLGTLALSAGSIDDAAAWCILATVLASFQNDSGIALRAIGGGIGYALLVIYLVRPLLGPLGRSVQERGQMNPPMFSFVLMMLMLAAWFTDYVGIYAVFGAFILGTAMPRGRFAEELQRKIEPLTTNFLLPLFFVYSGLNTRIDLVDSWELWGIALLVLACACIGKFVACSIAARCWGTAWRDSLAIGALMNARGLMELIILNIGLERGLITPQLFSVMVLMAIVTTLMATPLFNYIYRSTRASENPAPMKSLETA